MNKAEIRVISRAEYADFLSSVPHSLFQQLEWLTLMERLYPLQIVPLGCFIEQQIRAVIPLMRRRFGLATIYGAPLRKCTVPPATSFCAPATEAAVALGALERWVRRNGIGYVQATLPIALKPPAATGDAIERLDNLELRLNRPLSELWQLLAKKTRYTVRRAIKDGIKLHWAFSPSFMGAQEQLLHDTYTRQGTRPNYPLQLYKALLDNRHATGLRILYASFEGRVVAAAWLLTDRQRCYYWDAASVDEGRELNANQPLVWCMIRWAQRRGLEAIDFVGTARGGRGGSRPGIGHFKRSMGAEAVDYRIVYWYSPVYRFALHIYRWLAWLRRQLSKLKSM